MNSIYIRWLIGALAAGCFFAASAPALSDKWTLCIIIIVALGLAIAMFWRHRTLRMIYGVAIAVALGITLTGGYIWYLTPPDDFYTSFDGEGTIVAEPVHKEKYQQLIIRINPSVSPLSKGRSNSISPESNEIASGSTLDPKGPLWGNDSYNVLVRAEVYPLFNYGDKVKLKGSIEKAESFETDQGTVFDYPNYLLMKYKAVGIVSYPDAVEKINSGNANPVIAGVLSVKHKVEDAISETMPEPQGALDQGLLTGTRVNFTEKFEEALRRTGTTHIIAISGYNITIILTIFFLFVRRSAGFWPAIFCGFLAIILFTILTGANASIVRASVMGSLGLVAILFGRQARIEHTIFIAAGIMILINPLIVRFDAGFQLSFLAVLGLVYFAPKFDKWFSKIPGYTKMPDSVREAVSSTFAAQTLTWPVILILFGQISLIAPLVNAIILPFIPLAMALGFGAATMALVVPIVGNWVSFFPWLILSGIVKLIEWVAQLPWVVVETHQFSPWWIVVWFGVIIIWLNYKYVKSQIRPFIRGDGLGIKQAKRGERYNKKSPTTPDPSSGRRGI